MKPACHYLLLTMLSIAGCDARHATIDEIMFSTEPIQDRLHDGTTIDVNIWIFAPSANFLSEAEAFRTYMEDRRVEIDTALERDLPPAVRAIYEQDRQALQRGDMGWVDLDHPPLLHCRPVLTTEPRPAYLIMMRSVDADMCFLVRGDTTPSVPTMLNRMKEYESWLRSHIRSKEVRARIQDKEYLTRDGTYLLPEIRELVAAIPFPQQN